MKSKFFFIIVLFLFSVIILLSLIYASVTCQVCDTSIPFVTHNFSNSGSIFLSGLNLTITSSKTYYYQQLDIDEVNRNSLNFTCLSDQNKNPLGAYLPINLNESNFTDLRMSIDGKTISYSEDCGNYLTPYYFDYETGCNTYALGVCSVWIFGFPPGMSYTLIASNFSSDYPNWAYPNVSCLFMSLNASSQKKEIIQAYRVQGNGGQYCNIQDRWDYFVYSPDAVKTTDISSVPDTFTNSTYINRICTLQSQWRNSTFNLDKLYFQYCSIPDIYLPNYTAPPNITNTTSNGGAVMNVWFPDWIYVVILILDFILCCFLFYFGAYKIVGCIVFATGLVLMFSGIIWIISFPVFIGGIAILFIPEQFSLRKK